MKKVKALLFAVAVSTVFSLGLSAQTLSAKYMSNYCAKHPNSPQNLRGKSHNHYLFLKSLGLVDTTSVSDSAYYAPHNISILTPSLALSFTQVKPTSGGFTVTSNQFVPEFSYSYVFGSGTRLVGGGTSVNPYIGVGAIGGAGVTFAGQASVQVGGQVSIWKYFALSAQYDIVAKEPVYGFSLNVPFIVFNSDAGTIILNKF